MKTFKYENLGFEITLPDGWYEYKADISGLRNFEIVFVRDDPKKRAIHICAGALFSVEKEPTIADTKDFFKSYTDRLNYTNVTHGTIGLQGKQFFWGQYLMPAGVLVRKYSFTINRIEYLITCQFGMGATSTEREMRKAEREYEEIISGFRFIGSVNSESLKRYISSQRSSYLFKIFTVCLISVLFAVGARFGWFESWFGYSPMIIWSWVIFCGITASVLVYKNSRSAGLPILLILILNLVVLYSWVKIIFSAGLL